ncbi:PLP-dependent aminotransferase family protein [Clostridium paraputrificum]|uniref:MocR-like pyridoxine biosynthesis transcription factor PdxR n=1 Tax=Clostridium paraputrificum TaxID=29363 RepID=UPI003D32F5F3
MIDLNPILTIENKKALYRQLYEYIKNEIIKGNISAGNKLPSIRQLSDKLNLSRVTIENAYQQLISEGYVISKPRSGLYVNEIDNYSYSSPTLPFQSTCIKTTPSKNIEYDFDPNGADLEAFPYATWKKILSKLLLNDRNDLYKPDESQGNLTLRKKLATYLNYSRNVQCDEGQIIIGATVQQLINIVSILISKNDMKKAAIEDPGCMEMKSIFKNLGYEVSRIPLDNDGVNIDNLYKSNATVLYTTPSKQFPSGMVTSISKRLKILKWANENDALILEGDYDGEYRYIGNPIPSLQGLSLKDNVIYISNFSKYLFPSVCISYMVLPKKLLPLYHIHCNLYEQSVSRLNQEVLFEFMDKGYFERHIHKMRKLYSKKHSLLINLLNKEFNEIVKVIGKNAGLHILIEVKNGMTEEELVQAALNYNIKVHPYSYYLLNSKLYEYPRILLGFGFLSLDDITEAVKILRIAWAI